MLKNLVKYDLKSIYKTLIVFYILAIMFGILTRLFFSIENSVILNIIGHICSGVTISMVINIIINSLMRLWVNFKNDFYGDKSYLTHTLPITKDTLYLSKILASVLVMFTGIITISLALFLAYYSKDLIIAIKDMLIPLVDAYNSTIVSFLLSMLFIFFLEFICALQMGFTGLIFGHRKNNHKVVYSVLFGFGSYAIMQLIVLVSVFIVALFNKDLMNLFFTNTIVNIGLLKTIVWLSIVIYSVLFIVNYIINLKVFRKGVNVD